MKVKVFAIEGCSETHLICVSQTLTKFSYALPDGLASTSRRLLLLNLLFSLFTCLIFQLALLNAIFRSPDEKKRTRKEKEEEEKNGNQLGFNGRSMYRAEASF